mmetsp:Transcript_23547/g.61970  ORF Transcript_23547/g.61970 Transcript_23547/m.61970 type:complete len:205 (-) Transcript_23547:349-963(-)
MGIAPDVAPGPAYGLVELLEFKLRFQHQDFLVDGAARSESVSANTHQHRVLLAMLSSELLYTLRPRGGEHQHLPIWSDLTQYQMDLLSEALAEHLISLVENDVGDAIQVGPVVVEQLDEAPGSSDHDVISFFQSPSLINYPSSAVDARTLQATWSNKLLGHTIDLQCELSCRTQDHANGPLVCLQLGLRHYVHHHGKEVCQRLA